MSISINTDCKNRLIETLSDVLGNLRVNNRMFLDSNTVGALIGLEKILPERGELRLKLSEYIHEYSIQNFVYSELSRELREGQEFEPDSSLLLPDLSEYSSISDVADRLVNHLETVPWQYAIAIRMNDNLSSVFKPHVEKLKVCDDIRFVTADECFSERYSLQSGIESRDTFRDRHSGRGLLGDIFPASRHEWDSNQLYLQFDVSGYWGYFGSTTTNADFHVKLSSFLGLGIATRLFLPGSVTSTDIQRSKIYVHKLINESFVLQQVDELELNTTGVLAHLGFDMLGGLLSTDEKQVDWVVQKLFEIGLVFSQHSKSEKLLLASQWLYGSYVSDDRLLAFVQATVVLEILLGDKASSDQIGLGVLLRNRCAYLIGGSQSERSTILKEFQQIYDVRSTIVHGGKNRLTLEEVFLFHKLQWMCSRVLQIEISQLVKESA